FGDIARKQAGRLSLGIFRSERFVATAQAVRRDRVWFVRCGDRARATNAHDQTADRQPRCINMFTKAIVRPPGANYATGLTTVDLGAPDLQRGLKQHEAHWQKCAPCGLNIIRLAADEEHPDSTFVEDTAVLTARGAVIT